MRRRLGREEEVPARPGDRLGHRLAGEQVVAKVDRPQSLHTIPVGGQLRSSAPSVPAPGGVALAILLSVPS